MKKLNSIISTIILGGFLGISAQAEVVSFDATLASPDTNNATVDNNNLYPAGQNPSWYNGSGNPQGGWTIDTNSGIELGLRTKIRNSPSVIDTPTDAYTVDPGGTGSGLSFRSFWNYEFSIDLRPNGIGSLTLGDITASLTVADITPGHEATSTVNPLTLWTDNEGFGTTNGLTNVDSTNPATLAEWGAQNSQNPVFPQFPLAGSYDPYASDTYEFTLSVKQGNTLLASDTMDVVVSPEPSTWILLASGGLLLFFVKRRSIA